MEIMKIKSKDISGESVCRDNGYNEPFYNGHPEDRIKWLVKRGGRCKEVLGKVNVWIVVARLGRKTLACEVRWPLVEVRLLFSFYS